MLTTSFVYVRDWINEHPFKNSPNANLICNLITGASVRPDDVWTMMNQLKRRIVKMIKEDAIKDTVEKEKIGSLLRNKKWNPYCLRHSSISSDSDYLLLEYTDFLLKTKVGVVKLHSEKSSNFKAVCEKFNEYTNREETA